MRLNSTLALAGPHASLIALPGAAGRCACDEIPMRPISAPVPLENWRPNRKLGRTNPLFGPRDAYFNKFLEELPLRDLLLAPLNMRAHPASDSPLEFQRVTGAEALQLEGRALCRRNVNDNSNSERLR